MRERLGFGEFNEHSEKEITFELRIRESGYQSLTFCQTVTLGIHFAEVVILILQFG